MITKTAAFTTSFGVAIADYTEPCSKPLYP